VKSQKIHSQNRESYNDYKRFPRKILILKAQLHKEWADLPCQTAWGPWNVEENVVGSMLFNTPASMRNDLALSHPRLLNFPASCRVSCIHGQMNYKDTKPCMSAFLSVALLTDFVAFCSTDFTDRKYIHSWFVFSTQFVNFCPHGRRNNTCVLLPLYCTFSLTSSPLPPLPNVQYMQTIEIDTIE
jgi:hypothetical protein